MKALAALALLAASPLWASPAGVSRCLYLAMQQHNIPRAAAIQLCTEFRHAIGLTCYVKAREKGIESSAAGTLCQQAVSLSALNCYDLIKTNPLLSQLSDSEIGSSCRSVQ